MNDPKLGLHELRALPDLKKRIRDSNKAVTLHLPKLHQQPHRADKEGSGGNQGSDVADTHGHWQTIQYERFGYARRGATNGLSKAKQQGQAVGAAFERVLGCPARKHRARNPRANPNAKCASVTVSGNPYEN